MNTVATTRKRQTDLIVSVSLWVSYNDFVNCRLIAGHLSKITREPGESFTDFVRRVKADPLYHLANYFRAVDSDRWYIPCNEFATNNN